MSAIEFVVRDSAGNLRRGVLAETETSTVIPMGAGEDVSLNLRLFQVTNYQREGDNLVITTMDGRTITLEDYFFGGQMDANDLYLSADGLLTPVELQQFGDTIEPVYQTAELFGKWSPNDALFYTDGAELDAVVVADEMVDDGVESTMLATGLLGGLGAAGGAAGVGGAALAGTAAVAALGGGSDDDDDDDSKDDPDDPDNPGPNGGPGPDTTPPALSVDEGVVGSNDVFNRVDHADGVELAGKGEPGSTIVVETEGYNGQTVTQTTTVDANGDWDVVFPANDIRTGEYFNDVTITATDAAGNTATVTDQIQIDTETAVDITMVDGQAEGAGNVVNAAGHANGITLSGTGDANGTVKITVAGQPPVVVTAPIDANGDWSYNFDNMQLPGGEYSRNVTVEITDPYGNTGSSNGTIVVDTITNVTMAPGAGLEGTVINEAERDSNGITLGGTTQPNNTVAVTFIDNNGNQVTRNVQADGNGNWSANFAASEIPDGEYDAGVSVVSTDAAGNTATTSQTLRIDTEADVTVNTATLKGNGIVNFTEASDGITLTGTTDPNATVTVDFNGISKVVNADGNGNWSADYRATEVPSGERMVPVSVRTEDPAGNIATDSGTVEIDTIVRNLGMNNATSDNVLNAAEVANGFTLTGTTEPGAQWVEVTFGTMAAQRAVVDANGNWSLDFNNGIGNNPDGPINVTVQTMDRNDNIDSVTQVVDVDTTVPGAPEIIFRMQGQDSTFGLGLSTEDGVESISSITNSGTVTDLGVTSTTGNGGGSENFTFSNPVPDGTHLIVQAEDAAGNEASTLIIQEDGSTNSFSLSNTGLDNFDIAAIDLSFAENGNLTITEADLLALSESTNTLIVHGDAADINGNPADAITIDASSVQNTGQTENVGGKAYEVYSIGTEGTLLVDPDIDVNTI
ncbi:MAG: Ig-like domain-containing protein [Pseudomonadota bacterium]